MDAERSQTLGVFLAVATLILTFVAIIINIPSVKLSVCRSHPSLADYAFDCEAVTAPGEIKSELEKFTISAFSINNKINIEIRKGKTSYPGTYTLFVCLPVGRTMYEMGSGYFHVERSNEYKILEKNYNKIAIVLHVNFMERGDASLVSVWDMQKGIRVGDVLYQYGYASCTGFSV